MTATPGPHNARFPPGNAKLCPATVIEMRRRYVPRDRRHGANALAREFGLQKDAVQKAIWGVTWKWVPMPGEVSTGETNTRRQRY